MDDLLEEHLEELLDDSALETDLEQALNLSELCRRRFRSIAQVAGLLVQGFPGKNKTAGQLQISGSLLWDVFNKHEPGNFVDQCVVWRVGVVHVRVQFFIFF